MKKRYTVIVALITLSIAISAIIDFDLHMGRCFSDITALEVESDILTNNEHTNILFDSKLDMLEYIAKSSQIKNCDESKINFGTNIPGFLRLYLYDREGNGYCNGKFLGNFSDQDFFTDGMSGRKSVYVEAYMGSDEFYFCVPVVGDGGDIKAVLAGICSSKMVYENMMINNATTQRIFICDSVGRIVLSDPTVKSYKDFGVEMEDLEQFFKSMDSDENGVFEFDADGTIYQTAYSKLKYNDWYIVAFEGNHEMAKKTALSVNIRLAVKLLLIFAVFVIYFKIAHRIYKEQVARVQEETALLTKTIPGSTMMCKLDELLTIKYASEVMYSKLGYVCGTDNTLNTLGLREIIHPDDLKGFNKLYDEYKYTSSKFEYECRFICKNGKPRWMNCYARFVNNINGIKNLYIVAIDISEQKEAELRLMVSEQRYKAVVEQSNSVVFEYNIKTHDYFITNNFYEQFNLSGNSADVFAVLMKQHRLHSDDKFKFERMISDVYTKCGFREEELRIIDASNKHSWYSMKITSLSDTGTAPARIIGNISNIDALKKSTIKLENQAQSDLLTNCYNRETSLAIIRNIVENKTEDTLSALIVIDIDRFRDINDSYGHEVGDELLKQTAQMLKSQVRATDILGRIGDDEFIIFLRDCSTVSQIISKVEGFIDKAHQLNAKGYNQVTLSIGVAMHPANSRDYDELYDMADKAVYISKTTGCDKYTMYDANIS